MIGDRKSELIAERARRRRPRNGPDALDEPPRIGASSRREMRVDRVHPRGSPPSSATGDSPDHRALSPRPPRHRARCGRIEGRLARHPCGAETRTLAARASRARTCFAARACSNCTGEHFLHFRAARPAALDARFFPRMDLGRTRPVRWPPSGRSEERTATRS